MLSTFAEALKLPLVYRGGEMRRKLDLKRGTDKLKYMNMPIAS
jgi:hypothetical protein